MNILELRRSMRLCMQTSDQSVLQHGISVARYYKDLLNHLTHNAPLKYEWRLPSWIYENALIAQQLEYKSVLRYLIYHDCAKPLCLTIDDRGRHFPNHAEDSANLWQRLFSDEIDIAYLMRHDMDLHKARVKDAEHLADTKYWATQILCAWSELHSNAENFGGIDSTSFKIKFKALDRVCKKIVSIKGKENENEKIK